MKAPTYVNCEACRQRARAYHGRAVALIDNDGTAHLRSTVSDLTFCHRRATYMPRFSEFFPNAEPVTP